MQAVAEGLVLKQGYRQALHLRSILGREPVDDPFHVEIIRDKLMRSLVAVLPDVIDELQGAVPDYIHAEGDGTYSPIVTCLTKSGFICQLCRVG